MITRLGLAGANGAGHARHQLYYSLHNICVSRTGFFLRNVEAGLSTYWTLVLAQIQMLLHEVGCTALVEKGSLLTVRSLARLVDADAVVGVAQADP